MRHSEDEQIHRRIVYAQYSMSTPEQQPAPLNPVLKARPRRGFINALAGLAVQSSNDPAVRAVPYDRP